MRIDDLNRSAGAQSTEKTDAASLQQRGKTLGKDPLPGSDQADVSPLARALSVSDPSRIEQLRLTVQSGKYELPAEVVANAIINAHLSE